MFRPLQIIALSILAAILYGILHDQVTARVCIEYFTIGHPPVLPEALQTSMNLAVVWGILATWWMGLILGIPLALAADAGSRPRLGPRDLLRPIAMLLLSMALLSLIAGLVGYGLASTGDRVVGRAAGVTRSTGPPCSLSGRSLGASGRVCLRFPGRHHRHALGLA